MPPYGPELPHATVGRVSTEPVAPALPETWNPSFVRVDENFAALLGAGALIVPDTDALSDYVPTAGHEGSRPVAYAVHSGEVYLYDPRPFGERGYEAPYGSVPADGGGVWLVVRAFSPGTEAPQFLYETADHYVTSTDTAFHDLFESERIYATPLRPLLVTLSSTMCSDSHEDPDVFGGTRVVAKQGSSVLVTETFWFPAKQSAGPERFAHISGQCVVPAADPVVPVEIYAQYKSIDITGQSCLVVQPL